MLSSSRPVGREVDYWSPISLESVTSLPATSSCTCLRSKKRGSAKSAAKAGGDGAIRRHHRDAARLRRVVRETGQVVLLMLLLLLLLLLQLLLLSASFRIPTKKQRVLVVVFVELYTRGEIQVPSAGVSAAFLVMIPTTTASKQGRLEVGANVDVFIPKRCRGDVCTRRTPTLCQSGECSRRLCLRSILVAGCNLSSPTEAHDRPDARATPDEGLGRSSRQYNFLRRRCEAHARACLVPSYLSNYSACDCHVGLSSSRSRRFPWRCSGSATRVRPSGGSCSTQPTRPLPRVPFRLGRESKNAELRQRLRPRVPSGDGPAVPQEGTRRRRRSQLALRGASVNVVAVVVRFRRLGRHGGNSRTVTSTIMCCLRCCPRVAAPSAEVPTTGSEEA
jgi:hypothetical protein